LLEKDFHVVVTYVMPRYLLQYPIS